MRRGKRRINAVGLLMLAWAFAAVSTIVGALTPTPTTPKVAELGSGLAPVTINAGRILAAGAHAKPKAVIYMNPEHRKARAGHVARI